MSGIWKLVIKLEPKANFSSKLLKYMYNYKNTKRMFDSILARTIISKNIFMKTTY